MQILHQTIHRKIYTVHALAPWGSQKWSSELGEHFAHCGMDNMSMHIIDCVRQGEDEALSILEGYWQNRLATLQANNSNINIRNEWKNYMGQQPIFF